MAGGKAKLKCGSLLHQTLTSNNQSPGALQMLDYLGKSVTMDCNCTKERGGREGGGGGGHMEKTAFLGRR